MSYPYSPVTYSAPPASIAKRAPAASQTTPAQQPADWQARATSSYRQAQRQTLATLPELLASRVSALTGRSIVAEDVFLDQDAELATIVVDGVVFRAHHGQVVVLRACVECGIARFESAPLYSRADLGYALSGWQPRCQGCEEEDSINWLES